LSTTTVTHPTPEVWDSFAERQGGHLLQTSRWGRLKRAFGWGDAIVALEQDGTIVAGALVLYRRLPLGLGTIAYVPRGPIVDWENQALVESLLVALDEAARRRRAILLKLEPDVEDAPSMRDQMAGLGLRPSPHTVQPPRTILLDIGGTDDDILGRMNQGTRRKIRTASKREVTVRRDNTDGLTAFNTLMSITGQRDSFGVHSPEYYRTALDLFAPDYATLLIASYQGRDLGGLMAFALGKRAWYFYGASSNDERERMPNYALQWEAIRWAREHGCTEYDLWGIPDEDEVTLEADFQTRSDGLWGVYGFKRGFGGRVWRAVGAWDRVYNPVLYAVYGLAVRGEG
jgi:peptidoglycan pentaglycine glycine transferase (the first glycine)